MVSRRRRRARGMTLIEVMVALLITTVALLGALAIIGVTVHGATFSRNASEASVLAQSKLEQVVSLPAGTTSGALPATTVETKLDANGNTGGNTGIYTRQTVWSKSSDSLRRQVTVTVTWTDAFDKSHQVTASRVQALE